MNKRGLRIISMLALAVVLFTACGGGEKPKVRIGSKEFTEQLILGNMYEMLLDDAGFDAVYTPMAGTSELHRALVEDEIDIYPEYTGTGLLTQLKMEYDPSMGREEVYNTVKEAYLEQYDLVWLEPTSFNNTYVLVASYEKATELGISTVSDLSAKAGDLVFGTTQEFIERPDGLPGIQEVYGGFQFKDIRSLDPGLLYSGMEDGSIDVTTGFGTDGQIVAYDLVVLEDDKNFWPPYPAAPIVRKDILDEHSEIEGALNKLSALLDDTTMSSLNWEVAGNGREADEVAREFLQENGLIE